MISYQGTKSKRLRKKTHEDSQEEGDKDLRRQFDFHLWTPIFFEKSMVDIRHLKIGKKWEENQLKNHFINF